MLINNNLLYIATGVAMCLALPLASLCLYSPSFSGTYLLETSFELETFNFLMLALTGWIGALILIVSYNYAQGTADSEMTNASMFVLASLGVTGACIAFFSTSNLVLFYIIFEISVFPTLIIITKWGYQPERLVAGVYLVMYTICASLPLLLALVFIISENNSFYLNPIVLSAQSSLNITPILSLALCLAFLVNAPVWGVHLWLPKAHVEAPVSGSMVLAGILLNLGGYGLINLILISAPLTPLLNLTFLGISLWGLIVVSMICLRQVDINSLIAYSSVIHISIMVIGILSITLLGWVGAILIMIGHGTSSPGLFSIANFNYETTASRNILLQNGAHIANPMAAILWFLLLAANMAAPPSISLASEIFIVLSVLNLGLILFIIGAIATFLSAAYNLFIYSAQQGDFNPLTLPSVPIRSYIKLSGVVQALPAYILIGTVYLYSWSYSLLNRLTVT